jgi:hypothetical protein
MVLRSLVLAISIAALSTGSALAAQAQPQSSPAAAPTLSADKLQALDYTRRLEADPLAADAKELSGWLLEWVAKAPDIDVTVCDTLGMLDEKHYAYTSHLVVQTMFGMAAYLIEHPDAKSLDVEVQAAGVRSALAAYASILKQHPEAKHPVMDALAAHDSAGDLPKYMEGVIAKKCSNS